MTTKTESGLLQGCGGLKVGYKELWTKIFINLPYLKTKLRITPIMSILQFSRVDKKDMKIFTKSIMAKFFG